MVHLSLLAPLLFIAPLVSALTTQEISDLVSRHNFVRADASTNVPPPQTPLKPLTWSTTLAASAQLYASTCPYNPATGLFAHSGAPGVGENLFWGTAGIFNAIDAVNGWYSEKKAFVPSRIISDYLNLGTFGDVGHYTQIIWETTTEVGCGKATCGAAGADFWVCQYNPPGNFGNLRPYVLSTIATPFDCQAAATQYGVIPGQSWGSLPAPLQLSWTANLCDSKVTLTVNCQSLKDTFCVVPGFSWGTLSLGGQTQWTANGCDAKVSSAVNCDCLMTNYGVIPGATWGQLPQALQNVWSGNLCDGKISIPILTAPMCNSLLTFFNIVPGVTWGSCPPVWQSRWLASNCDAKTVNCQALKVQYSVVPGVSWGALPASLQLAWSANGCDTKVV